MNDSIGGITGWVIEAVQAFGYLGVVAMVALELLFPPIPSWAILPLAGFLAGQGYLNFVGVVAAGTLGAIIGELGLYGLGRWAGETRLRRWVQQSGRWVGLSEVELDRVIAWFGQHGGKAVLVGNLVPAVRSFIAIPAGFARMPVARFVASLAVGSAIFNTGLVALGWTLGDQWERVRDYLRLLEYVWLILFIPLGAWIVWRWRRSVQRRQAERGAPGR